MSINKHFQNQQLNSVIFRITCLVWLVTKAIGWRIYTTCRVLPTAPVFAALDKLPGFLQNICFGISIICLIALLFKQHKCILILLLFCEVFLWLTDQTRWHPWAYQYMFIVFVFIINNSSQRFILTSVKLMLVSTWFYAGLHKLNPDFLSAVWGHTILHSFLGIPFSIVNQRWLHYLGLLPGLWELIAGLCLLFAKTQRQAAIALILMHIFILVLIGPAGLNYNIIVWPWNIAIMLYLYFIFLADRTLVAFKPEFPQWNKLVLICWAILPALSFFGYWDGNLSSSIYAGNAPRMSICISDTAKCKPLIPYLEKGVSNLCPGKQVIYLLNWSAAETNVLPNPQMRVYKIIEGKLQNQYPGAGLTFSYFINNRRVD